MSDAPGRVVAGRYALLDVVATGGMGEVWRARDELLGREVAVKLLRADLSADPVVRERFRGEARAAAAIDCELVVDVYDYGEQPDEAGRCIAYLVMELVAGESLADRLARLGTLPPQQVAAVVADVAVGLAAAHRCGLVHRDVKPANVLLTTAGRAKLVDFGIARALDAAAVTVTGTVMGTAAYLAPEQVKGAAARPASDVFALGVLAYRCLAGVLPFTGDGEIATALARITGDPSPLPASVPAPLASLVTAMLDRDPARRPLAAEVVSSARTAVAPADPAVAADVTRPIPVGAAVTAGPRPRPRPWSRSRSRRKLSLAAVAVTAAALAVGVPMLAMGDHDSSAAAGPRLTAGTARSAAAGRTAHRAVHPSSARTHPRAAAVVPVAAHGRHSAVWKPKPAKAGKGPKPQAPKPAAPQPGGPGQGHGHGHGHGPGAPKPPHGHGHGG